MDYKLCLNYHESVLKLALDRSRPDVALENNCACAMSTNKKMMKNGCVMI
jgi:hypothetical protein